jgi:hypothetical protein
MAGRLAGHVRGFDSIGGKIDIGRYVRCILNLVTSSQSGFRRKEGQVCKLQRFDFF